MPFSEFVHSVTQLLRSEESETSLSRRDMLSGIGLVGAIAVAGSPLLMPGAAQAVEIIESDDALDAEVAPASYHGGYSRRRRRRRTRRRRLHTRRRRRPHVGFHLHIAPRPHYYSPRTYYYSPRPYRAGGCDYWHNLCARNWGYGNRNYYGCLRYHGCW